MLNEPYLAHALTRLPLVDATRFGWCRTLATDGVSIFFNTHFCRKLSEKELAFVLAHELLHCVLGHMDRRGGRERIRWNMAVDYATNLLLVDAGMTLPAGVLYGRGFLGMTAEQIYEALPGLEAVGGVGILEQGGEDRDGEGHLLDGHWDAHMEESDLEGAAFRGAGSEWLSTEERRLLRRELTSEMARKLAGRGAGIMTAEIRAAGEPGIPWQHHLARFVGGLRRSDYRLFPPNRKHLWRSLYLPAMGVPGPGHMAVAVDTSGSMTVAVLASILGEIDRLRSVTECSLTLVEFDAKVQRVTEVSSVEESPHRLDGHSFVGRGGTDIRLPFQWLQEQVENQAHPLPEALIVMTDGFGPLPEEEPPVPVFWIISEHGIREVPFGGMLRLGRRAGGLVECLPSSRGRS